MNKTFVRACQGYFALMALLGVFVVKVRVKNPTPRHGAWRVEQGNCFSIAPAIGSRMRLSSKQVDWHMDLRRAPMRRKIRLLLFVSVVLVLAFAGSGSPVPAARAQGQITSPEKFFGFQLGSDRKMARWDKMVEY
jgi:hypothetical protein